MEIITSNLLEEEIKRVVNLVSNKPGYTCRQLIERLKYLENISNTSNSIPSQDGLIWKLMFCEYLGKCKCLYGRWFVVNEKL